MFLETKSLLDSIFLRCSCADDCYYNKISIFSIIMDKCVYYYSILLIICDECCICDRIRKYCFTQKDKKMVA